MRICSINNYFLNFLPCKGYTFLSFSVSSYLMQMISNLILMILICLAPAFFPHLFPFPPAEASPEFALGMQNNHRNSKNVPPTVSFFLHPTPGRTLQIRCKAGGPCLKTYVRSNDNYNIPQDDGRRIGMKAKKKTTGNSSKNIAPGSEVVVASWGEGGRDPQPSGSARVDTELFANANKICLICHPDWGWKLCRVGELCCK